MAKRLTPFIGLAVVAALALAAAFGAFSLSPAFAGADAPNARGLAPAEDFQSQVITSWPPAPAFTVETDTGTATDRTDITMGTNAQGNVRMYKGETLTIDLKDSINNTAAAIATGGTPLINAWQLSTPAATGDASNVVTFVATTPSAATGVTLVDTKVIGTGGTSTSTEVTITAASPGTALLTVTAIDYDTTAGDPLVTGEVAHSTYTFSVTVGAGPTITPSSTDPGDRARYRVIFTASTNMSTGEEISIELEDFGLPGSATADAVTIESDAYYVSETDVRATDAEMRASDAKYRAGVVTPNSAYVSGEKLKITVPDMNPETDSANGIQKGDVITIVIQQGAGISNPTEGGGAKAVIENTVDDVDQETPEFTVTRLVELNEEDGGRGTVVTATGKGFKNGTSLGFFLDAPPLNGVRDAGEVTLCDVAQVGSDDTGSCSFTVNNPPFTVGDNFVGAVDGRGQGANKSATHNDGDQKFDLTPTISASPASGNPGDSILVQMYDFPANTQVTLVDLARQVANNAATTNIVSHNAGSTGSDGSANFRMTVPNWAPEGVLDLQVTAGGKKDNITITIGGPVVKSTPSTVLANQRINLVGTGFTPNSRVCCGATEGNENVTPLMTIGGETIPVARINDGDDVRVDSGGNWSASIDLPLTQVTSDEGTREIVVRDSRGRTGDVDVTIPARTVTIDPPTGRGGTVAVVRGENFPSKNDSGDSFNVEITYTSSAGDLRVSTTPDASGRFEAEITIPRLATIPSTNTVQVRYEYGDNDIPVTTTVTHQVPEGELSLSQSSGPPGTMVTVRGQGFRSSTPVTGVDIGDIEIPLSPAPYTTRTGGLDFDIRIPDLDTGVQTIEVSISGGTTASIGFTVTAGDAVGAETPAAEAVTALGDNFLRAFYFNNTTKSWSFYDPEVEQDADADSALVNFIAGASYWVLIGADQEVILNRKTRNLTCVDDNCWNLVVW